MDFELPDAIAACRLGLLERIDAAALPPGADGAPAARDFVKNAVGPCWVGSVVYSQVIAYAPPASARRGRRPSPTSSTWRAFPAPGRCAAAAPSTISNWRCSPTA